MSASVVETAPGGKGAAEVAEATVVGRPTAGAGVRRVFIGRGTIALADQVASSAATFLTGAIVGRTCPVEEFGVFALSLSVLAWVTNLQSAFVTTPFVYGNAAMGDDERRVYAGSTLVVQGAYACFATGALLGAAGAVAHGGGPARFAPVLAALGAMAWFLLLKEYGRQMAFAHLRVTSALWLDAATGVLQIGGLVALALAGGMSGSRAYWIIGAASALPSLCWLVANRRRFRFERADLAPTTRRNWEFGRWLLGGYVLNAVARDGYPWMVTVLHGARVTGTLAACTGVAFLVSPVVSGISNVLAPSFARSYAAGGIPALRRVVGRMTVVAVAGVACYCALAWGLGGRVAALIYGRSYAGHGATVGLLSLSVAATALSLPLGTALYVLKRADVNFRASAVAVVVMAVAGIALVRLYGVTGAAAGLICGNAAESAYKWYRYARVVRGVEAGMAA